MATTAFPKVYGNKEPKCLWESICNDFAKKRQELESYEVEDDKSTSTVNTQYSSSKHTPAVYGHMVHKTNVDTDVTKEFDPSVGHPALIGLSLLKRPTNPPTPTVKELPNPKTCNPTEYLENFVFPTLLPVIGDMLREAGQRKCFEKKRFGFNPCDYLTEYLYKTNSSLDACEKWKRKSRNLFDIPFVADWLMNHPREPLPLSLVWSEDEAAVKIQAYYRGYRTRVRSDVMELRQWQRDWRDEKGDIRKKVQDFWVEAETRASEAVSSARNSASTGRRSRKKSRCGSV